MVCGEPLGAVAPRTGAGVPSNEFAARMGKSLRDWRTGEDENGMLCETEDTGETGRMDNLG
jgi:hypothetical protein